jgi:hypothetical protein
MLGVRQRPTLGHQALIVTSTRGGVIDCNVKETRPPLAVQIVSEHGGPDAMGVTLKAWMHFSFSMDVLAL